MMMMMNLSLGTPPLKHNTRQQTPRSADTRVYRDGQYWPETHRHRCVLCLGGGSVWVIAPSSLSVADSCFVEI